MGVSRDCPKFLSTHYSNDSAVAEERNFQRLLLAICSETLHRIYRICIQHRLYSPLKAFR